MSTESPRKEPTYVFVGGPADGKRLGVPDGQPTANYFTTEKRTFPFEGRMTEFSSFSCHPYDRIEISGNELFATFFVSRELGNCAGLTQLIERYGKCEGAGPASASSAKSSFGFGQALDYLKAGETVTTPHYAERGEYVALLPVQMSEPFLVLKNRHGHWVPWTPTHAEMLRNDWRLWA